MYSKSYQTIASTKDINISEEYLPHKSKEIWNRIKRESEENELKIENFIKGKSSPCIRPLTLLVDIVIIYMDSHVFPLLLNSLESTLEMAVKWKSLNYQKYYFNGIDNIAEYLWNKNPKYPERHKTHKIIHELDWVQEYLRTNPRPIYPKSYLWTKEEGSTVIQSFFRGHLIRKLEEVQEMRQFWKQLKAENTEKNKESENEAII